MNLGAKTYTFSPADRLGETKEYYFSTKLRQIEEMNKTGTPVLNLGIGSPDLPPHPTVIEKLASAAQLEGRHKYQSYRGIPELRAGFADLYSKYFKVKLADSQMLPLIGSKEGVMHIAMALVNPGDMVLVPNPGYPAYSAVSNLAGAQILPYNLTEKNGWLPDLEALEKEELSSVKLMWINYPNMPTGTAPHADLFKQLIAFAKKHNIILVNDNPYAFILNETPKSMLEASVDTSFSGLLELNSLSKSHNMAGWRVGLLAGDASLIGHVLRYKSNMDSGMFKPVQEAATVALGLEKDWYDSQNKIYKKRRAKAEALLNHLDCAFDKNQAGMFLWASLPKNNTLSTEMWCENILQKARVFLTPGFIFGSGGESYVRISLCSSSENFDAALERIKTNLK